MKPVRLLPTHYAPRKFISAGRVLAIKMAAAAIVCRRDDCSPSFIIVTDNRPTDTAHLVAQALGHWSKKHPVTAAPHPHFLSEVIQKAVGL